MTSHSSVLGTPSASVRTGAVRTNGAQRTAILPTEPLLGSMLWGSPISGSDSPSVSLTPSNTTIEARTS